MQNDVPCPSVLHRSAGYPIWGTYPTADGYLDLQKTLDSMRFARLDTQLPGDRTRACLLRTLRFADVYATVRMAYDGLHATLQSMQRCKLQNGCLTLAMQFGEYEPC